MEKQFAELYTAQNKKKQLIYKKQLLYFSHYS